VNDEEDKNELYYCECSFRTNTFLKSYTFMFDKNMSCVRNAA
jgi:hypothetical protein